MGMENLFGTGGTASNERETTWQDEVHKQSTQSELQLMLCFILITSLGVKIQI
jgi:hypothetical protein